MRRKSLMLSLGLTLSALFASLTFAATAGAVRPPEPGPGSPVIQQPRTTTVKKAKKIVKRNWGGYPQNGHTHVRSPFAPEDP
jgi:hypothetical protein